jgi:hypothetical protein
MRRSLWSWQSISGDHSCENENLNKGKEDKPSRNLSLQAELKEAYN